MRRVTDRRGDASDATAATVAAQAKQSIGILTWRRLDASLRLDALKARALDLALMTSQEINLYQFMQQELAKRPAPKHRSWRPQRDALRFALACGATIIEGPFWCPCYNSDEDTIKLPYAVHGVELERAPVIAVSGDAVTLDGKQVAATEDLAKGDVLNVPELEDALREEKRKFEFINANNPDKVFRGMVNVQADQRIQFKVIKRVMFACNQSGFGNISFAAMAKGAGEKKAVTASN